MDVFRHYRVMTQKLKENNTTRPRILRKKLSKKYWYADIIAKYKQRR